MFTTALLTVDKIWKPFKCPLIDEWIKKNITCSLSYAKSRPKNQNIN
jgi:hypothetical protein